MGLNRHAEAVREARNVVDFWAGLAAIVTAAWIASWWAVAIDVNWVTLLVAAVFTALVAVNLVIVAASWENYRSAQEVERLVRKFNKEVTHD